LNKEEIDAVRNHISNIPAVGAVYAPVLLEWLVVALKERDAASERLRASEDLYKKSMDMIHEAAGIKRDGLVAILAWIEEARAR
jgi:hypothetical protein